MATAVGTLRCERDWLEGGKHAQVANFPESLFF